MELRLHGIYKKKKTSKKKTPHIKLKYSGHVKKIPASGLSADPFSKENGFPPPPPPPPNVAHLATRPSASRSAQLHMLMICGVFPTEGFLRPGTQVHRFGRKLNA